MNIELLQEKMTEYFRTVTPEEIIADYEAMGAVFEDIPCPHHKPIQGGYFKYEDKYGKDQRQCPDCLRWFFHGEFGRGWAKGLKQENSIHNILKP